MAVVLITGGAGFIGSSLAEHLLNKGHRVICIDNFDPFYSREIKESNMAAFKHHTDYSFYEADIRNADELKNGLPKGEIEIVIHLAAKVGVLPSLHHPEDYLQTNVHGTLNLLEWMKESKIRKMIFASSSSVYGNQTKTPFSESDNVDFPISPYAFTKKSCELLNHTFHHLHQMDIVNLRFFTVYGPRQRPDLAIYKFVKSITEGKPVTMYGEGQTARDYTHVSDIVMGIEGALNFLLTHSDVYEIVNLGNHHPVKLSEMIDLIYKKMGVGHNIKKLPMQQGDVNSTFADITKAGKLFGYSPRVSFQEGISEFISWYKEHNRLLVDKN